MSASLFWEPMERIRDREITASAPSAFMEALELLAGSIPCILDQSHVPALRALARESSKTNNQGYQELAEAIDEHGPVRVTAVY